MKTLNFLQHDNIFPNTSPNSDKIKEPMKMAQIAILIGFWGILKYYFKIDYTRNILYKMSNSVEIILFQNKLK